MLIKFCFPCGFSCRFSMEVVSVVDCSEDESEVQTEGCVGVYVGELCVS